MWLQVDTGLTVGAFLWPGPGDDKEGMALNRVIRLGKGSIECEAGPRQAGELVCELGFEGAKSVVTPGVELIHAQIGSDKPLEGDKSSLFRTSAARANYLSADRIDIHCAAEGICRFMAAPTEVSVANLKRLGRFLEGHKRLLYQYPIQVVGHLEVYSDIDWAGCPFTRKSTSGGCTVLGVHVAKSWSSTQPNPAMSSSEAGYYGVVKAAGVGLGYQALLLDIGIDLPLRLWTDSSAAIGVIVRQGVGQIRHLDARTLWLQQAVRTGRLEVRNVKGTEDPADLFTKHTPSAHKLKQFVGLLGGKYVDGRAACAPKMRRDRLTNQTLGGGGQFPPRGPRGSTPHPGACY